MKRMLDLDVDVDVDVEVKSYQSINQSTIH
jgi:hypothetical protein